MLAVFQAGAAKLRKASADCVRDLVEPKTGSVRFAVDVEVANKAAQSKKVEVLDRGKQTEAFDACLVNELADVSWPAELPDGKLTFEYTFELAELGR